MPKVGGRRKKVRSHKDPDPVDEKNLPKSFVFKRGKVSDTCKDLTLDFRKCFYPNTAMKLEDNNKLEIKSYMKAAKYYSVTHLIAFQQLKEKTYTRFIKIGGGEILFKVINYCRMKDVLKNGGQPFSLSFKEPLIVLNNFTENNQVRQIGRSIQQLFPNIDLDKIKLSNIKRVMSFTYQHNKKCIYFRHYKVIINEGGITTTFKELNKQANRDISQFKSFSDFLNHKGISQQKNLNSDQQEVKLVEMGPRMKLKFVSFKQGIGKVADDEDDEQMGHKTKARKDRKSKKEEIDDVKEVDQNEQEGEKMESEDGDEPFELEEEL